jgi:uncharacterized protein (TIGR03435 family)
VAASETERAVPIHPVLLAVWGIGALLALAPMLAGLWQMRVLRRDGIPASRGRARAERLAADTGLRRPIDVRLHAWSSGPMTCGLVRPAILFPPDAETWSDEALLRAIVHELEHVRRGDWATQLLARAVCAFYWFHPLVWIAWRRLRLEAERACDDAVLRRSEATAYADQLVRLAEQLVAAPPRPLVAMAAPCDLTVRVKAVLDGAQSRGRAGAALVTTVLVAATVLVGALAPLRADRAQPPATVDPQMSFEVASVRPSGSDTPEQFVRRQPGGRFDAQNMPLRALITFAYGIQSFQLEESPDWISTERFNIQAKAEHEIPATAPWATGPDPLRTMLQNLLADRFKLKVRRETKEMSVLELVTARPDGAPGPGLLASTTDCQALMAAALAGKPAPPGEPNPALRCGVRIGLGRMDFNGSPMTALASALSQVTQGLVVDRTNLAGAWDFELTYAPDPVQSPGAAPPGAPPQGAPLQAVASEGPSLFAALAEQLGLRLRSARAPVEVLVIEHVERPGEN